jgi:hypothetical protein
MRRLALAAVAVAAAATGQAADTGPRLPYFDWGACPFEGCTYRSWQAKRSTTVWLHRDRTGPVAYQVAAGEWVEALTGVVITYKPGISKVLKPMTLGQGASVAVVSGDILLTLHYLGEGYDLFWFKGKTYQDQIASDKPDPDPPPSDLTIQVISRPRSVWWVKVKNKKRQVGWTDRTKDFAHMDAFE